MKDLTVGDNGAKKTCRWFVEFAEHWFFNQILRPVLFLLPPAALSWAASDSNKLDQLRGFVGDQVIGFISESSLLVLIAAYVYVAVAKGVFAAIKQYSKPAKSLSTQDVMSILHILNGVVSDKTDRIGGMAKKVAAQQSIDAGDTFKTITNPGQQITLLTKAVRSIFTHLDEKNASFRIGLLRVQNNAPVEWVAFDPLESPPRTEAAQLNAPTSTVKQSIVTKSLVVVGDIQKELSKGSKGERRFVKCNTQPDDQGSQLCLPITHPATGKIEYVITVAGNKKDCLVEKHRDLYQWILDHFVLRLSLEHSLLILKEKANER